MLIWDASKTVRRSWRQNSSVTLKGDDCGLVVGTIYELSNILQSCQPQRVAVILSEYETNINVDPKRFNRYYERTEAELINSYIFNKVILRQLLAALRVLVYDSNDLNNYNTCKCLIGTVNEPIHVISEFEEFACFKSDKVSVELKCEQERVGTRVLFSLYGTYFLDKVVGIRKATLLKNDANLFREDLTMEEFFSLIINGNLNSKQKDKILQARDQIETNYRLLTTVTPEELDLFALLDEQKCERNKTRFKLLNLKFGYNFPVDFIDSLFAEVNRVGMVVNGR